MDDEQKPDEDTTEDITQAPPSLDEPKPKSRRRRRRTQRKEEKERSIIGSLIDPCGIFGEW